MGQRVDENGVRPHPGLLYKPSRSKQPKHKQYGEWTVGPCNAPSNGGIGRINNVAFHPSQRRHLRRCSEEVCGWCDDGQSWQTFTDELTNIGVSDVSLDPVS